MSTQPVSPDQAPIPVTDWLQELDEASPEPQAAARHEHCRRFGELPGDPIELGIALLFEPGQTVEMRIPKAGKHGTVSGYFNDFKKLAEEIRAWSGKVEGVYYTLNPVAASLLARSANRAKTYAKLTTSDSQIVRRCWLPIDIDPARPAGISSTNDEKELARLKASAIYEDLRALQWPEPLKCDSGNGYHLLYLIDLSNDEAASALLERCLKALAAQFDDDAVKIDQKVFNAARIIKAYGSLAAKGDNIPDRPHRVARCYRPAGDGMKTVSLALLEALAAQVPAEPPAAPQNSARKIFSPEKVEQFLQTHGIEYQPRKDDAGAYKWVLSECLFNSEHKAPDAAVLLRANGVLGYECFHNSCTSKHWKEFRAEAEKRSEKQFRFFDRPEQEREKPRDSAPTEPHESNRAEAIASAEIPVEPTGDEAAGEESLPDFPKFTGSLADLADALCPDLPFCHKFMTAVTLIGAAISGRVWMEDSRHLDPRFYTVLLDPKGAGKGGAYTEIKNALRDAGLLNDLNIAISIDSGPALVHELAIAPRLLLYSDELSTLFEKAKVTGTSRNSLFGELISLYESHEAANSTKGNLKTSPELCRGKSSTIEVKNAHFAMLGAVQPELFQSMWRGIKGGANGLQSRFVLASSGQRYVPEPQRPSDHAKVQNAISQIKQQLEMYAPQTGNEFGPIFDRDHVISRSAEQGQKLNDWTRVHINRFGASPRLAAMISRLQIVLAVTNGSPEVTPAILDQSLAFGEYQIQMAALFMPADAMTWAQEFEQLIVRVFEKHGGSGLTFNKVRRFVNPEQKKLIGGFGPFLQAWKNLLGVQRVVPKDKTRRGTEIYVLDS